MNPLSPHAPFGAQGLGNVVPLPAVSIVDKPASQTVKPKPYRERRSAKTMLLLGCRSEVAKQIENALTALLAQSEGSPRWSEAC